MPKIILSRKGFDSASGKIPSPVIDGKFLSLPIPQPGSGLKYSDLKLNRIFNTDFNTLFNKLRLDVSKECHMDPNISPNLYGLNEQDGWHPAFGQHRAALTHLLKTNSVEEGDIFLFFGRFKHFAPINNIDRVKDFHAFFGFMEIGKIINIKTEAFTEAEKKKYANHPHIKNTALFDNNSTLFIPAKESKYGFQQTYGTFKFHQTLVLSEENKSIRNWKMPKPFTNKNFSYKMNIDKDGLVKSPGRGQEMVGNANDELILWIREIIREYSL